MISGLNDIAPVREYLKRIGAEPRSLKTAVVRENHGKYWKDIAIIRFHKDGTVDAPTDYEPTEDEQGAIKAACATVQWPEVSPLHAIVDPPDEIRTAPKGTVFEFRNEENLIVMVQVRRDLPDGGKVYLPWTYWSDGQWRRAEPEGPLPLYNAHKLKEAGIVFIHEGAKAAAAVQKMVDGKSPADKKALVAHPWGRELANAVHLGWIGGALSPTRTDWSCLQKAGIKKAIIVADNDAPGKRAVPAIAKQLRIPTYAIQFTEQFPVSFDLADPFPEQMFGEVEGVRYYNGPAFQSLLYPATWATDIIKPEKGKAYAALRESFKGTWAYIEDLDLFVCKEDPTRMLSQQVLDKSIAAFSDVQETGRLILRTHQDKIVRVCYRPDIPHTIVEHNDKHAINLHVPSTIKAEKGNPAPWLEFLSYLFPNKRERSAAERWLATLIARPEVRIGYGMLLVSEKQGVGKTTLGSNVLAPLVGRHNVGHPSEADVNSDYNGWIALKRLVLIQEIYSGSNWKAYNALKSVITDQEVSVNQKYQRQYVIENWAHVLACSNSMRALKMENDDRRWFYPEVTEVPWKPAQFASFRNWLQNGGLQIIRWWAENYGDYVGPGERAPMTDRKKELIDGSRSEAQREAVAIAETVVDREDPLAIVLKDVVRWCHQQAHGRVYEQDYELKRTMVEAGMIPIKKRLKVAQRLEYVMVNPALARQIEGVEDESVGPLIRQHIKRCGELMEGAM